MLPPETLDLSDPVADLLPYSGQMLQDIGVEIVTTEAFTTGVNTTNLVINNPTEVTLDGAHLFLEFINISGTVASEVPVTVTVAPGPNVAPIAWNTAAFSPTFQAGEDYIVMAFWTDYQGNILDTAGRPLSSFQEDPKPVAVLPTATWNFGAATQGQVLHHTLDVANTGFMDLRAYVSAPAGMGVANGHRILRPGDVESYDIALDTSGLPLGPYSATLTLRTGDPANPGGAVLATGNIVTGTPAVSPVDDRPLDLDVAIPGAHGQGEGVEFTHSGLGVDAGSLHPTMVYSQGGALLGVGEYATNFAQDTFSYGMFGDGRDGDLTVSSNVNLNSIRASAAGTAGSKNLAISNIAGGGFQDNQMVLIHQTRGGNTGVWEFNTIETASSTQLILRDSLQHTYTTDGGVSRAQVLRVPQYQKLTINAGVTLSPSAWNGLTGGIFAVLSNDEVTVNGTILAAGSNGAGANSGGPSGGLGIGFYGGYGDVQNNDCMGRGGGGEGTTAQMGGDAGPNGNGGGGSAFQDCNGGDGAGGGNGTTGENGTFGRAGDLGQGGISVGTSDLTVMDFGGGGAGSSGESGTHHIGGGGGGGGIILIFGRSITVTTGLLNANGGNGNGNTRGSGGGAGGSLLLKGETVSIGSNRLTATGGVGGSGSGGGAGGVGRIRVEYCETFSNLPTTPPASTQKLNCYIIEQIESAPYTSARLNLPESFSSGRAYRVQYGRRLVFPAAATLTTTLRIPAREAAAVTFDALVSDFPTDTLTFRLDVGADGVWDWQPTQAYAGPTTLSSPDLATEFEAYRLAHGAPTSGDLDVPIRVSLNGEGQVLLTNLYAPATLDLAVSASDVTFGVSPTVESAIVPVVVTLHNDGGANPGGFTVAFYAESQTAYGASQRYVGSAFVPGVAAGGTAQAGFNWNTLGFTGTTALRVVVDPYSRLSESDRANNEATASLPILTRPDLVVEAIALSDDEPVVGEAVTVTLTLRNTGQAPAAPQTSALYLGAPESGVLLGQRSGQSLSGGGTATLSFTWAPTITGQYRLFAVSDRAGVVNESDEGNNRAWRDVYVGFAGPLVLDAGSPTEPGYTEELGFGVLDEGTSDVFGVCASGDAPALTHRRDPDGQLAYRFDHLLPGHFYHLDVVLYECDRAGRQESVYVDGNRIAGPEDLGDGQVHHLSLLVDPVLYADRSIRVTLEAPDVDGAIVSQISLHDISYRYVDAGGPDDPQYAPAATSDITGGWLDGVDNTEWGVFSRQSVRVDQEDAELRYRFDHLNPAKRYRLHFTFYQPSGQIHIQRVKVDGTDVGITVNTGDYLVHHETTRVPLNAYLSDGSILVRILRLNAWSGAMVNEIMLEEETLPTEALCQPVITPNFTDVLGNVTINGEDAPVGSLVQALSPRGDTVGCFLVERSGQYGMMRIYGEDTSVTPAAPGMRAGEIAAFRVDGAPAVAAPLLYWQDDKTPHPINLNAGGIEGQVIFMPDGWNLISLRYEPPVPLVAQTLDSIAGRYSRVLGETGIYAPSLPPIFQSLTELHPGEAYYTYITGTTNVNLILEGSPVAVGTPLALHRGWNWVGYLPATAQPVTVALQSIAGQYQRVLGLTEAYDPLYPDYSGLKTLQPGEGYLIYMNQAATLVYPSGSGLTMQDAGLQSAPSACDSTAPTPYLTLVYGQVILDGLPAPAGTRVEAFTPRGEVAGCFVVESPGRLALTHVYGADSAVAPAVPGFAAGEALTFRVNGLPVSKAVIANAAWADDKTPRYVELHAASRALYLPLVLRMQD